jgi:hypothetical protein
MIGAPQPGHGIRLGWAIGDPVHRDRADRATLIRTVWRSMPRSTLFDLASLPRICGRIGGRLALARCWLKINNHY